MKTLIATMLLAASAMASADVLVVNIWNPLPGKAPTTFQYGQEARAIHEKLGANVTVGADQMGRMHYAMAFDNWAAWAEFGKKLDASADWAAFIQRINADPSATREDVYMLNQPVSGGVGQVYQVNIWTSNPGRNADTMARAMEARALHEKAGVKVAINVDQLGRLHYVASFESWADWAKFQDTPNPDFEAMMTRFSKDPSATLTKVYTAQRL
ncbi:MAG: hypothetical protein RIE74_16360 [Pseudomonadales bacterium]